MKKKLVILGMSSFSLAHAQYEGRVGINTTEPQATLHVEKKHFKDNRPQGVLFPEFDDTPYFSGLIKSGTMVFNKAKQCLEIFAGNPPVWSCVTTVANSGGGTGGNDSPSTSDPQAIPPSIIIKSGAHFLVAVYDDDYLPYTVPSESADWKTMKADGKTDPLINLPQLITAQGIPVRIPITATNSGILKKNSFSVHVPAYKTQDGQGRELVLTWEDTPFTDSDSFITAWLKSPNGDLKVKQLDLNNGIGYDKQGVELAKFIFNANSSGSQQATIDIRVVAAVPDKKFGAQTNGKLEHQYAYIPIQGPDGKVWLNNNLGAEYAEVNSIYFSPIHQAGSLDENGLPLANPTADQIKKDFHAYGYLYEWKRDSDGHEVIHWTSSVKGDFSNPSLQNYDHTAVDNPKYGTLGDPCPLGFHIPKEIEWRKLHEVILGKIPPSNAIEYSKRVWEETCLKFSASGFRYLNSPDLYQQSNNGWYWSGGAYSDTSAWDFNFSNGTSTTYDGDYRTYGFSVRCIAD